jgi:hypothetical protein
MSHAQHLTLILNTWNNIQHMQHISFLYLWYANAPTPPQVPGTGYSSGSAKGLAENARIHSLSSCSDI